MGSPAFAAVWGLRVLSLLPRDAIRISAVFAVARCLSVCLWAVALVLCVHTAENIVKLLCRPGSATILVFLDPSNGTQFQGTH